MSSSNFTYDDAIQAARQQIQDDAQRRWSDNDILTYILPRVLQQLRADRPDMWIGLYGTENFKPSQTAAIPFDDAGYNTLVEAIIAAVNEEQDESANDGVAAMADAKSERSRRT